MTCTLRLGDVGNAGTISGHRSRKALARPIIGRGLRLLIGCSRNALATTPINRFTKSHRQELQAVLRLRDFVNPRPLVDITIRRKKLGIT